MLRAQADDAEAFTELYGRHADYALGIARAICRDRDRAEDAVQDGFFSIWRSRAEYRPRLGSFEVWSMRIVRNRAIDSLPRDRGAGPRLQATAGSRIAADEVDCRLTRSPMRSPTANVLGCSTSCADCPTARRRSSSLSFYGEFSHSEIATRLGSRPAR